MRAPAGPLLIALALQLVLSTLGSALRTPTVSHGMRAPPPTLCCPALNGASNYARGSIDFHGVPGVKAWWRQDPQLVEVVVALPDDVSFKRDVELDVSRTTISLSVCGEALCVRHGLCLAFLGRWARHLSS